MTIKEELMNNPALQDELRRMQSGEPYNAHTPEMYAWRGEVKKLLRRLNITEYHEESMKEITRELLPNSAPDVYVEPPFYCDYGNLIFAEEGVLKKSTMPSKYWLPVHSRLFCSSVSS